MKIHLVDGTYELFRNHFGAPPKKAPDGREVGATLGLLRSLLMLLQSDGVTHVGVAFDHVIESFRNDLYTGYKTGEGVDANLLAQLVSGDHIVCWDRRREIIINEAGVVEKFGVSPASIPDWLAVVGDSADGYPGIPGWGAKSASAVLAQYRHMEKI